jgi:L-seryl-tRNA(Ser) seleniumtransferase
LASETSHSAAEALRSLPQVERLMGEPPAIRLSEAFSRKAVTAAVRAELQDLRSAMRDGAPMPFAADPFFKSVAARLERAAGAGLRRAVNATGIVLHTNLGRAPLAAQALEAAADIARGYANLELDLASGRRGRRHAGAAALLRELTGAEAGLVVNNNAAAVLLALSALAAEGEVVVSRGELVEIGGSFRIPDIIAFSRARLVEVGTTNRTRLADYERAITPETRVLLKVHPSNYRIEGFTSSVTTGKLAALAHERGLLLVEDLGSGSLVDLRGLGLAHEPSVPETVAAGADLVTFSGDKLLGGPQAGLIVGRETLIARLERYPLMRAVRPDKLTLAALEATLRLYQSPERLPETVPVLAMLAQGVPRLQARAERLLALLAGIPALEAEIVPDVGYAGGGSLPEAGIPTRVVRVLPERTSVEELARRLRIRRPAVVGRIAEGWLRLDMRTVTDEETTEIARALGEVLR